MPNRSLSHAALCITAASLAACGGSQPPIGAPGAVAQNRALSSGYEQLYRFHRKFNGVHPESGLLNVNGLLYGTTSRGGLSRHGTVFSVSTSGVHNVVYRFRGGSDGSDPHSGLIDVQGTLYGTTASGGSSNAGTVYSISTSGVENVLYAFKGGFDGADPLAGLVDVNGTLYGTTFQGGGSGCYGHVGCGTVFSVTTSGKETVLYRFSGSPDGASPFAGLIDVNDVLYGTTLSGGSGTACGGGCGTVFEITTGTASEEVLYDFQGNADGYFPQSSLVNLSGLLYGTVNGGGPSGRGFVYSVSTKGTENILYSFAGGSDGAAPVAGLINVNGLLYGTTTQGGGVGHCFATSGTNCGTVYSLTTAGVETVLYRFVGGTDGWYPVAALTNVHGTLYGTTVMGGNDDKCCTLYGLGTVFSLSP